MRKKEQISFKIYDYTIHEYCVNAFGGLDGICMKCEACGREFDERARLIRESPQVTGETEGKDDEL